MLVQNSVLCMVHHPKGRSPRLQFKHYTARESLYYTNFIYILTPEYVFFTGNGEIYCKTCYGKNFGPKGYGYGAGAGALTRTK